MLYLRYNINKNPSSKFISVPCKQQKIPTKKKYCEKTRRSFKKNLFYRNLFINRLGPKINPKRTNLRICNRHKMEKVIKQFTWLDNNGKLIQDFAYFKLPVEEPITDNTPTTMNNNDEQLHNISTLILMMMKKNTIIYQR
jgi:hypothetical protein